MLELIGVIKRFGRFSALDRVDFAVRPGEVHALVGENGAGKSTLVKLLSGVLLPSEGEIRLSGAPVGAWSPREAIRVGVATVHQHRMVAPTLSVLENIVIGQLPSRGGMVNWRQARVDAERAAAATGLDVDLDRPVGSLTAAQQTLVEVARATRQRCSVLILDEPTAALAFDETDHLLGIIDRQRAAGKGVILVSHFLDEVYRIADSVTVLRNGRRVFNGPVSSVSRRDLVSAMLGREVAAARPKRKRVPGAEVLGVEGVAAPRGFVSLDLSVRRGEVVGVLGPAGGGQEALTELFSGLMQPTSGTIRVAGKPVRIKNPRSALDHGIRVVPPDRHRQGLVLDLSLAENARLNTHGRSLASRVNWRSMYRAGIDTINQYRVAASGADAPMSSLSGGNQQKVLLARWLTTAGDVYVLGEPTAGIDIGAKEDIHLLIDSVTDHGKAVLLASSDVEEILRLSDRILVFRKGRVVAEVARDDATRHVLAELVTGAHEEAGGEVEHVH